MNKRKLNIIIPSLITFALFCFICFIINAIYYIKQLIEDSRYIREYGQKYLELVQSVHNHTIFSLIACAISSLFCVSVSIFLIYLFYRINKTELLAATEDVNAYRERKAAERNARRKAIAEKKKAAIERELAALNTPEEDEFSEK